MTSPTQRALPPLPEMQERHNYYGDPLPRSGYTAKQMQAYALAAIAEILADYAALQARIAELEARNAASERDAERWRWIRENANPGFTQSGKPWGLLCASLEVRAWPQIEAAIDAHARGQAGEE